MDRETIIDSLTVTAQRKAAEMFLKKRAEVFSNDAASERKVSEEEALKAESDVADAAYSLEQRIRAIDGFEELLNEEELQRAQAAFERRRELTEKIGAIRQKYQGVDLEKSRKLNSENEQLEKRIARMRNVTTCLEKYSVEHVN